MTGDLRTPAGDLPTSHRAVVMGVLNVTPDSFSDGGRAYDPADHPGRAVAAGRALLAAGADLVDVGGESTRPGADPVGPDEEAARVVPVVAALAADGAIVSVDTRHTVVARAALDAGAAVVNDVGAVDPDAGMLDAVAAAGAAYVAMHMRGEPRTMQDAPSYADVVGAVEAALLAAVARAEAAGVAPDRIAIDPGIGFGKTLAQNLALLAALPRFAAHGRPVLVGTSRKSFLGRITGVDAPDGRLAGSLASAVLAVRDGARLVRVHDVADTVAALRVLAAVDAASAGPAGTGSPAAGSTETEGRR
jgi:dihydropteroate synthase